MGNCVSTVDREAAARSQEIDKQIEEDSRKFKKECKILLLGECSLFALERAVRARALVAQEAQSAHAEPAATLPPMRSSLAKASTFATHDRHLRIDERQPLVGETSKSTPTAPGGLIRF